MSTVIYISGKLIYLVSARGRGAKAVPVKAYTMPAPEGSVINGIITDPDVFMPFIRKVFHDNKLSMSDVSLVVNSTKLVGKRIELPKMNSSKRLEYIAREYNELDRGDTPPVYAYTPLYSEKGGKVESIYAESVESSFVKDYMELFAESGIKLKGIYSSEGTMIKMVQNTAARRSPTFVVQVADDNMLTNVLWANERFCYFSCQRCFSEPGSPEYLEECARALSQLTQFMKANQIEGIIRNVYIAGIEGLDLGMYRELLSNSHIETAVDYFDCGLLAKVRKRVDQYSVLPALAGLLGQEPTGDMLAAWKAQKTAKRTDTFWRKSFLLIGAVAVIMITLTAVCIRKKNMTRDELEAVKFYNESPSVQLELAEYEMTVAELNQANDRYASFVNIRNAVETYPIFNDAIREPVERCALGYAEIEIVSFDALAGALSFTAKSERVQDINKFVARLQEEEIFSSVFYSGYSLNGNDGTWNIHVTCTLAESAGRQE